MKENNCLKETDKIGVSNIIGVILMVAIAVATAAVVFIYASGVFTGVKDYSASVACITDSSTDRITITTVSPRIKWSDIMVTADNASVNWRVYDPNHNQLDIPKSTSGATAEVEAGDYIEFDFTANPGMSGNVFVNLIFVPTNSLLGSWIITV
jgi:FlaG/FlaF family flagellin (archaellin)